MQVQEKIETTMIEYLSDLDASIIKFCYVYLLVIIAFSVLLIITKKYKNKSIILLLDTNIMIALCFMALYIFRSIGYYLGESNNFNQLGGVSEEAVDEYRLSFLFYSLKTAFLYIIMFIVIFYQRICLIPYFRLVRGQAPAKD